MKVVSNGNSYMEFTMQITAVGVRDSSSDKSVTLGSWKSGFDSNMTLENPLIMNNYTADIVYRIVTVEVITIKLLCRISFYIFSKNHS